MSFEVDIEYEIEKKRRQAIFNARVKQTTQSYLSRYRNILSDIQTDERYEFVKKEHDKLSSEVTDIERLLKIDPAKARSKSQRISHHVFSLPKVAGASMRKAQHVLEKKEARRQEEKNQLREELEQLWQSTLLNWEDPLARQMAFSELMDCREQFFSQGDSIQKKELIKALQSIQLHAEDKAQQFRQEQEKLVVNEVNHKMLSDIKSQLSDPGLLAQAESIKDNIELDEIISLSNAFDDALIDESCRREVVKAIYQSLQAAGFSVDKPRYTQGVNDEVLIKAARPAGATAHFKVSLDGRMEYRFDRYKGSACKNDINKVLPALQDAYGIKLSNQRVIWKNPDDKYMDAKPNPIMEQKLDGQ